MRQVRASGVLPKLRRALPKQQTFWEVEEIEKASKSFDDPKMKPKNADILPVVKKEKSLQSRIRDSAKDRTKERKPAGRAQRWKLLTADMRRKYYKDSLELQHRLDVKDKETREAQFKAAREARLKIDNTEQSEATRLTLPTVESFLKGPFVIHRTPEETKELKAKRAANRRATDQEQRQQKVSTVLEIYQNASSYIIDEAELDKAIDREFNSNPSGGILNSELVKGYGFESSVLSRNGGGAEKKLAQTLLGTTSNLMPGYAEVQEALQRTEDVLSTANEQAIAKAKELEQRVQDKLDQKQGEGKTEEENQA